MSTNPFVMALGMYVIITCIIYISIKVNKNNIAKKRKTTKNKKRSNVQPATNNVRPAANNDMYHIGGITTDQFILELLSTYSLDHAGYSYEELHNKKTQVGYGAYDLFDILWVLFGTFDEILACDYVEDGYGTMTYKEVQVRYNAKKNHMRIDIADITIEGTLEEIKAFRHNPIKNYEMLDPIAASNHFEDYTGDIIPKY
ncbi:MULTISPECIES: hypothetical protein [Staphylococcus]|uniref:hypothetical protein n=1 Tax=Staphylococcus TaxID=1279 RepID=UPI00085BC6F6|nr:MULTISPECIES: hypothetical protein [Staphylococcus]EGQ3127482.1 hypothetical protein [Staphylococcus pseudintermedius]MDN5191605.1 hypothetical protein [Staphylococcus aureus]MDN5194253.1 hypothetical protein [Staphylococcus aureus]MDN5196759.1 hypothetical protein [Staphylococcus aureus]MDN5199546.1 hypothetical protein [Staphylococcus aureus]